jgi:hypothetical protein
VATKIIEIMPAASMTIGTKGLCFEGKSIKKGAKVSGGGPEAKHTNAGRMPAIIITWKSFADLF